MLIHAKFYCTNHSAFPPLPTGVATQAANCSSGDLRLTGGSSPNEGRLEVCLNGAWGSVCDSENLFTTDEAVVACRQLDLLQVEGKLTLFLMTVVIHKVAIEATSKGILE